MEEADYKARNANWAESVEITFYENIQSGDYVGAQNCIGDMRDIFPLWAGKLQEELNNTKIINSTLVTPYAY